MDRIKFYYMEYSNCKETDRASTTWDHGTKSTRFDKQIDNMHVSIQSRTPPKGTYPRTSNYKIEIEENNMQEIDVTVRMDNRGINIKGPSNFSRSHAQSQNMASYGNADKINRYEYQINYASQQNKSKQNYSHWDTKHTIRIIDCPIDYGFGHHQNLGVESKTQNNYTNSSFSQNGKVRVFQEKKFGSVAKNGKIIKANTQSRTSLLDDSVNDFTINESIHSKNKFESATNPINFIEQSPLRDSHKIVSSKVEQGIPQVPNINHKKEKDIQQKDQTIQVQSPQGDFKSIRNKDNKLDIKLTTVQTPKGQLNKKLLLTPQTGIRNKNSHSPSVYDYAHEDVIPSDDEAFRPAQVQKPTKITKPKLLLTTGSSHPPSPTIEKSIQKYFSNLNKSVNSSKKYLDKSFNKPKRNESPLSIGPSSRQKQSKQIGKDKINVAQKAQIMDTFTVNKNRYLDKLRRQQKTRSRMSQSRTLSRSQHSLSPECQAITDRLYNTKINKQPCPKFVKYHDAMQRSRVKDTLKNYTFISKYLSDHEIYDIMAELQENNVPENKWALKLVDIVYEKLKVITAN